MSRNKVAQSDQAPSVPAIKRVRPALRILGTSVTQIPAIRQAAGADLGLEIEYITLNGTEAQRRGALFPDSFDVYDQWFHDIDLIWPTGSIQSIDISRIHRWDEINALPKTGRLKPDQPPARGADPSKRLFVQLDGSLGDMPSDRISMVPTVHNADSFAVVGSDVEDVTSWSALLDPKWSGRVVLQSDAAIGSLDMLLALEANGELHVEDIGDLSLEEIDELIEKLRAYRSAGHFRRFWSDESDAIEAMMEDEPIIGSLWWSGLTKLRAKGRQIAMATPREGYRGWFGGLSLSVYVDNWAKDAAYDYLNWWLDGRAGAMMASKGAYMANPSEVRSYLGDAEWDFWYEGEAAARDIRDTDGAIVYPKGSRREGGSYAERMSRVTVWDTVMNEHNYLVRRWDHSLER
jgi:putative spermidine/putrescine transport system substrate-binding protein